MKAIAKHDQNKKYDLFCQCMWYINQMWYSHVAAYSGHQELYNHHDLLYVPPQLLVLGFIFVVANISLINRQGSTGDWNFDLISGKMLIHFTPKGNLHPHCNYL